MECPIAIEEREPEIKPFAYIQISEEDTGCVIIENRKMKRRLILDLSEPRKPRRKK